MNWYLKVLENYAVFSGRARRQEFWMFLLFSTIVAFILPFFGRVTVGYDGIGLLYQLAVLIPSIAVSVRRLHDTDRSGWWVLIILIPILGSIVLLVFMAQDGNQGENQYGADPKTK